ncbi:predicted protein [Sclerotinia sclerotiorum 1980 UF-70]|uniref:Uncharacterized protein n=1 Tax=Sclerotinia sclerotiorum (strain ATCC 18683 / 1980 / Ss-1) TaxID=665079 RepID=A7E9G6_SCLS1|nr:predicted protein [Sclerotinia sclerotiorum 1980 UF-70]EDN97018.1 predicted protein [Sclerotinia sclerotiorum 1980 UF-70]
MENNLKAVSLTDGSLMLNSSDNLIYEKGKLEYHGINVSEKVKFPSSISSIITLRKTFPLTSLE